MAKTRVKKPRTITGRISPINPANQAVRALKKTIDNSDFVQATEKRKRAISTSARKMKAKFDKKK